MKDASRFTEFDPSVKSYDEYAGLEMIRARCKCCTRCWAYTKNGAPLKGPTGVQCFYGGPYDGWDETP